MDKVTAVLSLAAAGFTLTYLFPTLIRKSRPRPPLDLTRPGPHDRMRSRLKANYPDEARAMGREWAENVAGDMGEHAAIDYLRRTLASADRPLDDFDLGAQDVLTSLEVHRASS